MKKNKFHKFELKQKKGSRLNLTTGANTELWMDGKKLKGVSRVVFDVKAAAVGKINIELVGEMSGFVVGKPERYVPKEEG